MSDVGAGEGGGGGRLDLSVFLSLQFLFSNSRTVVIISDGAGEQIEARHAQTVFG